ncbi:amidohydrolase [Salinicoccus sp. ID82-1]|uniref:Amidohydrolase n=1 Tax=Salinicoccus cyprini TaxID=2493691 RepID=A0A558ASX6_9STAP|nr:MULTISPECIES: amidohydrolase [Salinicoccus]MCG1009763.1 amidohydrolase [Salinicoccus sp. ID82-1]TVT27368.1 amidohydrolase [Salinicoccus cyprini]
MSIDQHIENVMEDVISWRRTMHRHPEISFQEHWTSSYIEAELEKIGSIEVSRPTETSVLGIIKGKNPGRKVGLRADIDALQIQEERDDIDFASENEGAMHACGHDGHAAILLGAAKVLVQNLDVLHGEVYLIFQHAEEVPPGGAAEMVATGLFDDLDFIYGQHLFTPIPTGRIGIKSGPITSNSDSFDLKIQGSGGHASQPENAIDPIIIGGQILNQFQTIVSRITSPLDSVVISTTKFHSGSAKNIIPDTAMLEGSVRTLSDETRAVVSERMEKAVESVCAMYGATYEFSFNVGYSAVVNDEAMTERVKEIAVSEFGDKVFEFPLAMGGEDFSAFSRVIPATYAWIGAGNKEKDMEYPHHHPKFGIDEDGFIDGVKMMVHTALGMTKG